jgi:predicted alpha/beta hydrolase
LFGEVCEMALALTHRRFSGGNEAFLAATPQRNLEELGYATPDGWHCRLHRIRARADLSGEPIVLAGGLGLNRWALDRGRPSPLVDALHDAGFDLFFFEHRGDRSAFPPPRAARWDADTLATSDLPSAIEKVLEVTGYAKVGFVGFGLGGQVLYIGLASDPELPVFAAVTIGAAVRFPTRGLSGRAARLAGMVPGPTRLPFRRASLALSPLVAPEQAWCRSAGLRASGGPEIRALLHHGTEDLGTALLAQVGRWHSTGRLVDRHNRIDWLESVTGLDLPLLVVASAGDVHCPPEAASAVLERLAGPDLRLKVLEEGYAHLDLLDASAQAAFAADTAGWLQAFRRKAW